MANDRESARRQLIEARQAADAARVLADNRSLPVAERAAHEADLVKATARVREAEAAWKALVEVEGKAAAQESHEQRSAEKMWEKDSAGAGASADEPQARPATAIDRESRAAEIQRDAEKAAALARKSSVFKETAAELTAVESAKAAAAEARAAAAEAREAADIAVGEFVVNGTADFEKEQAVIMAQMLGTAIASDVAAFPPAEFNARIDVRLAARTLKWFNESGESELGKAARRLESNQRDAAALSAIAECAERDLAILANAAAGCESDLNAMRGAMNRKSITVPDAPRPAEFNDRRAAGTRYMQTGGLAAQAAAATVTGMAFARAAVEVERAAARAADAAELEDADIFHLDDEEEDESYTSSPSAYIIRIREGTFDGIYDGYLSLPGHGAEYNVCQTALKITGCMGSGKVADDRSEVERQVDNLHDQAREGGAAATIKHSLYICKTLGCRKCLHDTVSIKASDIVERIVAGRAKAIAEGARPSRLHHRIASAPARDYQILRDPDFRREYGRLLQKVMEDAPAYDKFAELLPDMIAAYQAAGRPTDALGQLGRLSRSLAPHGESHADHRASINEIMHAFMRGTAVPDLRAIARELPAGPGKDAARDVYDRARAAFRPLPRHVPSIIESFEGMANELIWAESITNGNSTAIARMSNDLNLRLPQEEGEQADKRGELADTVIMLLSACLNRYAALIEEGGAPCVVDRLGLIMQRIAVALSAAKKRGAKHRRLHEIECALAVHGGLGVNNATGFLHAWRFTKELKSAYWSPHWHYITDGFTASGQIKALYGATGVILRELSNFGEIDRLRRLVTYLLSHVAVRPDKHAWSHFGHLQNRHFKVQTLRVRQPDGMRDIDAGLGKIKAKAGHTIAGIIGTVVAMPGGDVAAARPVGKPVEYASLLDVEQAAQDLLAFDPRDIKHARTPPALMKLQANPATAQNDSAAGEGAAGAAPPAGVSAEYAQGFAEGRATLGKDDNAPPPDPGLKYGMVIHVEQAPDVDEGAAGEGARNTNKHNEPRKVITTIVLLADETDKGCLICRCSLHRIVPLKSNDSPAEWQIYLEGKKGVQLADFKAGESDLPYLTPHITMRYLSREDQYNGQIFYDQETWILNRFFGQMRRPDFYEARPPPARVELDALAEVANSRAIKNHVRHLLRSRAEKTGRRYTSPTPDRLRDLCRQFEVTPAGEIKRVVIKQAGGLGDFMGEEEAAGQ